MILMKSHVFCSLIYSMNGNSNPSLQTRCTSVQCRSHWLMALWWVAFPAGNSIAASRETCLPSEQYPVTYRDVSHRWHYCETESSWSVPDKQVNPPWLWQAWLGGYCLSAWSPSCPAGQGMDIASFVIPSNTKRMPSCSHTDSTGSRSEDRRAEDRNRHPCKHWLHN